MTELKTGILLLFLFVCGFWDLKNREIPLWLCYGGAMAVVLMEFLVKENSLLSIAGGILTGLFLLAASKITRGQIGSGDGIVFLITGISLGMERNFLLLLGSLFIAFLYSLILLLIKKTRWKDAIPFLPFVFAAYVLELVM